MNKSYTISIFHTFTHLCGTHIKCAQRPIRAMTIKYTYQKSNKKFVKIIKRSLGGASGYELAGCVGVQ
jgi:hypothetical protein